MTLAGILNGNTSMQKFLIGTGIVLFPITAASPRLAIEELKCQIRARERVREHQTIGMSLVNALKAGTLNFIVFDAGRTEILAGELNGEFVEPATRALAEAFPTMVPPELFYKTPGLCTCGCS
jgi:hypothetical protein